MHVGALLKLIVWAILLRHLVIDVVLMIVQLDLKLKRGIRIRVRGCERQNILVLFEGLRAHLLTDADKLFNRVNGLLKKAHASGASRWLSLALTVSTCSASRGARLGRLVLRFAFLGEAVFGDHVFDDALFDLHQRRRVQNESKLHFRAASLF